MENDSLAANFRRGAGVIALVDASDIEPDEVDRIRVTKRAR